MCIWRCFRWMYTTPHSVVYLYTSSAFLCCSKQLGKYGAVIAFHLKRLWGWNGYAQMCIWVNFPKHSTDITPGLGFGDFSNFSQNIWPLRCISPLCAVRHTRVPVVASWFQIIKFTSIMNRNGLWKCRPTIISTSTVTVSHFSAKSFQ